MKTEHIIFVVLAVLVVVSVIQVFQISSLKKDISGNTISGNAISSSGGKIDTTGWTENEKMNYEHHGTIPARVGGGSPSSRGRMVGGC